MIRGIGVKFTAFTIYILGSWLSLSCTAQHHPEEHHKMIKEERMAADRPVQRLAQDGSVETQGAAKGTGNAKFDTLCATCHGLDGAASTPAAKALSPMPRNFTDAKWQAGVDDARIAKVIKEGGASVGLSPTMAPWGSMLSEQDITSLVATIRSFKK